MAFTVTANSATNGYPKLVEAWGGTCGTEIGYEPMVSGKATVTCRHLAIVEHVTGTVQGATGVGETVNVTATSGATFDIETVAEGGTATGTSVVMWTAHGKPKM